MIVGGKDKITGKFVFKVYDASNELFVIVEGDDLYETERRAEIEQRNALSPIMGGCEMTDDELLKELLS